MSILKSRIFWLRKFFGETIFSGWFSGWLPLLCLAVFLLAASGFEDFVMILAKIP
jgi:hypothetical protein